MNIQYIKAGVQKILNQSKPLHVLELSSVLMVALGIMLRLRQYFANRSLWVDEASLALNVINRSFGNLTQTLDYNQGAPIGFLLAEKFTTLIMGNNEYSLRLFPLVAGLLSIYLMYLIARERIGQFGLFTILLISLSPLLIYYSSEVKQYSGDLLVSLLLIYLSMLCLRESPRVANFVLLGIAGIFSLWISHPSIFVLVGIGLILAVEKLLSKKYPQFAWALGMDVVWVSAWGMVYLVSLRYLTGSEYLKEYWLNHFLPLPPWNHLDWYKDALSSLLVNINPAFAQPHLFVICLILVLIGTISFFLRNIKFAFIVTLPFLTASIASALQKYPLSGRFLLFLIPSVILLMVEGLHKTYIFFVKRNHNFASVLCGTIALLLLWTPIHKSIQNIISPPMGEHIKPVLAYVQKNMQEGDTIYVYSGSVNPFRYYASAYNLDTDHTIVAENSSGVKRFIRDVNNLTGTKRIWFIFSHVIGCGDCEGDKLQFHINTLDEYGVQTDRFDAPGASVFLYDLTR